MLFPISDDDREVDTPALVTYALLAVNVVVFLLQLANPELTYAWSVIPKEITSGIDLIEAQEIEVGEGADRQVVWIPQAPGPPLSG
jgi:hypothetical protein